MNNNYIAVTQKVTEKIYNNLSAPFILDLIALFQIIQEDVIKTLNNGIKEGKTSEDIIQEIRDLI